MVANPNTLFPNPDVRPSHQQQPLQLPQHHRPPHPGLLLCCICHEHNTTFRYEVIYKTTAGSISTLALKPPENFLSLQHQQQSRLESPRITELTSEGEEISGHQDSSVSGPDHCRPISKVGTLSLFDDQSTTTSLRSIPGTGISSGRSGPRTPVRCPTAAQFNLASLPRTRITQYTFQQ